MACLFQSVLSVVGPGETVVGSMEAVVVPNAPVVGLSGPAVAPTCSRRPK